MTLKEILLSDDIVTLDEFARKLEECVLQHPTDAEAKRLMHKAWDLQAELFALHTKGGSVRGELE